MGFRSDVRRPASDLARILGVDERRARELVAAAPVCLDRGLDPLSADRLRNLLFSVGAIVEVRSAQGVELSVPPTARAPERTPTTFAPDVRATSVAPMPRSGRPMDRTSGITSLSPEQRAVLSGSSVRPRVSQGPRPPSAAEIAETRERRLGTLKFVVFLAVAIAAGVGLYQRLGQGGAPNAGDEDTAAPQDAP